MTTAPTGGPVTTAPTGVDEYLLAFADDEHLMGQQHTEWIGVAPFLEEDLAFSSIGQDELGHAALLYELVLELNGTEITDQTVDGLAFDRPAEHFRSCELVEYGTTDWAEALVRHWLYDTTEELRWGLVANSSLTALAEIAARAEREEIYHRLHAEALIKPLLASAEAKPRLIDALTTVLPLAAGLVEPVAGEQQALAEGVTAASTTTLYPEVMARAAALFELSDTDLPSPPGHPALPGHQRTARSAHFGPLLARMREVFDFDPDAVW